MDSDRNSVSADRLRKSTIWKARCYEIFKPEPRDELRQQEIIMNSTPATMNGVAPAAQRTAERRCLSATWTGGTGPACLRLRTLLRCRQAGHGRGPASPRAYLLVLLLQCDTLPRALWTSVCDFAVEAGGMQGPRLCHVHDKYRISRLFGFLGTSVGSTSNLLE
jgi:hypothetical protein